jgi:hypothetical protein
MGKLDYALHSPVPLYTPIRTVRRKELVVELRGLVETFILEQVTTKTFENDIR